MRVRIVADEREKTSRLPELLSRTGVRVDIAMLKVGDYILSSEIAVERKTVSDLVTSVFDGRIFDQIRHLTEVHHRPILLIEGTLKELTSLTDRVGAVYGALGHLIANYPLTLLVSDSLQESCHLLASIAEHAAKGPVRGPLLKKQPKSKDNVLGQLRLVASLPGVGEKLAKRLLERFGSPLAVFNANTSQLARIRGVGYHRAEKITQILHSARNAEAPSPQAKLPD
jgi:DNA excision repair protein ERCC-4